MSRILIAGASKGIGRAMAVELIARGHHVVATARRPETLATAAADAIDDREARLRVPIVAVASSLRGANGPS